MSIRQFRYAADNLGYVIYDGGAAMAVDGGAVADILRFVREKGLTLEMVTHTHGHPDHTMGARELADRSGAPLVDHRRLAEMGHVDLGGLSIRVLSTPGHTADSVTFVAGGALITGDTLFNGTVGNCFSGDMEGFLQSIRTLAGFPGGTIVYAGHDYVRESMTYARIIEPDNRSIGPYLERYDPAHVRSTLDDEFQVNPYLRYNTPSMMQRLQAAGLAVDTEFARWKGVMSLG